MKTIIVDLLACPNCGNPFTDGKPCNLTCERAFAEDCGMKSQQTLEIQNLLKAGELSLADIARRFNVTGTRVGQIKARMNKPSREETRARLCVDEFLSGELMPPAPPAPVPTREFLQALGA